MLTSIVGTNWGDEGKGRMVDLLSANYDIVVRYQGGNNAGHTVINEKGKFVMNLMPSGICREDTVNILGPGIVIDLEHLYGEVQKLAEKGVEVTPEHLKISDRATICMPYHKLMDCLEEDRLLDKKFGSTRRGISPVYADKYMKKALRMGDLLHLEALKERLGGLVEWKNLTVEHGYGHAPVLADEMFQWLKEYGEFFIPFICDTTEYLGDAIEERKSILFEAQLGALRDIDFGIYPYTSASTTLASYAPIGAGVPFAKHTQAAWEKDLLPVNCLERKRSSFVRQGANMVQQPEDREESEALMWLLPDMGQRCRAAAMWHLQSWMCFLIWKKSRYVQRMRLMETE